jgi:maltose-binding protein MalE
MFKAIIVIVLIVVTVRTCSSEDKKRTIETTKETGTFLGRMGESFMEGYNEQKVKNELAKKRTKHMVKVSHMNDMDIIKKLHIREDSISREQLKNYVRQ